MDFTLFFIFDGFNISIGFKKIKNTPLKISVQKQILVVDGTEFLQKPWVAIEQIQEFLRLKKIITRKNFVLSEEGLQCYREHARDKGNDEIINHFGMVLNMISTLTYVGKYKSIAYRLLLLLLWKHSTLRAIINNELMIALIPILCTI